MDKDDKKIAKAIKNNFDVFMERGPGLDMRYQTWIVARDRKRKRVLIGGLGGLGVGQMWNQESDSDKKKPGYKDAPEQDSWMGFGTPEQAEQMGREFEKMRTSGVQVIGRTGCATEKK